MGRTELGQLSHRHTRAEHLIDVLAQRTDEPVLRLCDHLERRFALFATTHALASRVKSSAELWRRRRTSEKGASRGGGGSARVLLDCS